MSKVRPLPPQWQALGTDPELVMTAYLATIEEAIATHPRSQQKRLGPSEVGMDCPRRLAYKLAGFDERPSAPNWKATVGTAVHAWLERAFSPTDEEEATGLSRWVTEHRVDVGEIPGYGHITGSCDLYDRCTGIVLDHKVVGPTQLRKYKSNGPSKQYRCQAHLYARGWTREGLPATHVAICFLPRNGDLREAFLWHEPYDEQIAVEALNRLAGIWTLLQLQGRQAIAAAPTADQYCLNCPFFKAGSTDPLHGCPGHGNPTGAAPQPALTLTP